MTWKGGFDGVGRTIPEVEAWLKGKARPAWARGITVHNTGVPGIYRAREIGLATYVRNAGSYYKKPKAQGGQGWSAGPHFFVGEDQKVYFGTPFQLTGVHDPCHNSDHWGIEMIANFTGGGSKNSDDDDAGAGLLVKQTAAALVAVLLKHQGLALDRVTFHKECKRTSHDCPGRDVDKVDFMGLVKANFLVVPSASPPLAATPLPAQPGREHNPAIVPELGHITTFDLAEGHDFKFKPPSPDEVLDRPAWAVRLFRDLKWSKVAACCMVAQFQEEAYADLRTNAKGDKHIPGGSISLGQWNRDRKDAFLKFAALHGVPWDDFEVAILFANWELEHSEKKRVGQALSVASTIWSGSIAAIGYERPAGWSPITPTRPPSWKRRLDKAVALYNRLA